MMDSEGGNPKAGDEKSEDGGGHRAHHHHYHLFHKGRRRVLLLSATVALLLYHTVYPFYFFPSSYKPPPSTSALPDQFLASAKENLELETILKNSSMANKTVIITTLNEAWAAPNSIFDLFLESFRVGRQTCRFLNHLLVVALDQKAYDRCLSLHPHCYALTTDGIDFSGEALYMSTEYVKMMWRRIDFLRTVLKLGYNFIFTDADIMWFRDPFPHFLVDADFQIASEFYSGNSSDLNNLPNGGFVYVKSSTQTIEFYKFWYTSRQKHPGLHDQDVLTKIKHDPYITQNIGLHIKFLDTAYFGGFCVSIWFMEPVINRVCTMHANCCVGLSNKVHDIRIMLEDWKKYTSLPSKTRASQQSSWTVPQHCG